MQIVFMSVSNAAKEFIRHVCQIYPVEHPLLSTHADRQGADISFTVFVCDSVCLFVCMVTDFSSKDKASGIKFCTEVH